MDSKIQPRHLVLRRQLRRAAACLDKPRHRLDRLPLPRLEERPLEHPRRRVVDYLEHPHLLLVAGYLELRHRLRPLVVVASLEHLHRRREEDCLGHRRLLQPLDHRHRQEEAYLGLRHRHQPACLGHRRQVGLDRRLHHLEVHLLQGHLEHRREAVCLERLLQLRREDCLDQPLLPHRLEPLRRLPLGPRLERLPRRRLDRRLRQAEDFLELQRRHLAVDYLVHRHQVPRLLVVEELVEHHFR